MSSHMDLTVMDANMTKMGIYIHGGPQNLRRGSRREQNVL
ncbi:hypothetical protein AB205_0165050 [Aquarana catesbeiana]|uniref:Uncharacterized protein n=1 Tax=Aquarana catesbeiana TaxID=8400 RepID=A0A2G9S1R7_AQUCT|nr:hypothetical protein AB205_0165050 [Aquarana catesbeiana]